MVAETINNDLITEMAKAGIFYGHKKTKTHPRMKPFIGGQRNEIELLDPEVVLSTLDKAGQFLREKLAPGGLVLFVGTKAKIKRIHQGPRRRIQNALCDFPLARLRHSRISKLSASAPPTTKI